MPAYPLQYEIALCQPGVQNVAPMSRLAQGLLKKRLFQERDVGSSWVADHAPIFDAVRQAVLAMPQPELGLKILHFLHGDTVDWASSGSPWFLQRIVAVVLAMSVRRVCVSPPAYLLDLPPSFVDWPTQQLAGLSQAQFIATLNDGRRTLNPDQCFLLERGHQLAGQWIEAALRKLRWALQKMPGGLEPVKDWFGLTWEYTPWSHESAAAWSKSRDEHEGNFRRSVTKLHDQFQSMLDAVHRDVVLYVTPPQMRLPGAQYGQDYAFAWAEERIRAVYLQRVFDPASNQLGVTLDRWIAFVLVHELSHNVAQTHDHRYGRYQGSLAISRQFTTREATSNADTFAFFAADCAEALRGAGMGAKNKVLAAAPGHPVAAAAAAP
jgi:hypothetical protein